MAFLFSFVDATFFRVLCEYLMMCDCFLNFAQIAGTIGDLNVEWPGSAALSSLSCLAFPVWSLSELP